MNLDSFSLYTKLGFVPRLAFQDMQLTVPTAGMPLLETSVLVRRAKMGDIEVMAGLEWRLAGIQRTKDWRHLISNDLGCWGMWVAEQDGELAGFLGAVLHPGIRMVGPGIAVDEVVAEALLHRVLDEVFRGQEAVWLVPISCGGLVARCYEWGARNIELHLASVRGESRSMCGVMFPTFMPESG